MSSNTQIIDMVLVDPRVASELEEWVTALNSKSNAAREKERRNQDRLTEAHKQRWDRYHMDQQWRESQAAAGRTRLSRTQVVHAWDGAYGSRPVPLSEGRLAELQATRDDNRYQVRIKAALQKWAKYRGDLPQCVSDELRTTNFHLSYAATPQANLEDERRCPRCYASTHVSLRQCPIGTTTGRQGRTPPVVVTQQASQRGRGGPAASGVPYCKWCGLFGHRPDQCPVCSLCGRFGHATEDCSSGLRPGR